MIVRVGLHRLERNPFQTRTAETAVDELAASIRNLAPLRRDTSGLIHVPVEPDSTWAERLRSIDDCFKLFDEPGEVWEPSVSLASCGYHTGL